MTTTYAVHRCCKPDQKTERDSDTGDSQATNPTSRDITNIPNQPTARVDIANNRKRTTPDDEAADILKVRAVHAVCEQ